jgi:RNA-directed DNA polymerase
MRDGVVMERTEGTAQGSPLSPLLANVMLDEVDRILQQRKHRFARYADDLNVYVRSQRAGERVLRSMRAIYEKLHLRVNETKTVVGPAFGRKFLGYCFRRWSGGAVKIAVAPQALRTYKQRIRKITRRAGGRSMEQVAERLRNYMPGWKTYFQLAQTPATFKGLDSWLRRRLRAIQLKHWKRGTTIYRSLRRLGATHELAASVAMTRKRWWHSSRSDVHQILTDAYFDRLRVPRLA